MSRSIFPFFAIGITGAHHGDADPFNFSWYPNMTSTHRIVRLAIIASALSVLVGCGPSEDALQAHAVQVQVEQERQSRKAAEEARKEAEKARQEMQKARQEAEKARQEAAASFWRTATWLASLAAIGLLVVGTALGSSSQKDAKAPGSEYE